MYCSKCGNQIAEDARFCNVCGAENTTAKGTGSEKDESSSDVGVQNVVSQNTVSQNTVSQNTVSQNTVSQNTVSQNTVYQNTSNQNTSNQNTSYQNTTYQNAAYQNTTYPNSTYQNSTNQNTNQNPNYQNTQGTNTSGKTDNQTNKVIFMLSYLGILFFLPLVCCPNSKAGKFHANQGLVLLITSVVGQIVLGIIDVVLPWSLWALSSLLSFAWSGCMIALVVIGMVYAYKEEERPLPVIGGIRIIK